MIDEELRKKLFELIHRVAPEADPAKLGLDEGLREALDIDSFDFLKIVIGVHEVFGIDIPEAEYRQVTTLRGLADYVSQRRSTSTEKL
jgi:acyl carrier protein